MTAKRGIEQKRNGIGMMREETLWKSKEKTGRARQRIGFDWISIGMALNRNAWNGGGTAKRCTET